MTYTEDSLVEQPAIQLFAELGWETLSASDEVMGASGTLGRETKSEVVLAVRLRVLQSYISGLHIAGKTALAWQAALLSLSEADEPELSGDAGVIFPHA